LFQLIFANSHIMSLWISWNFAIFLLKLEKISAIRPQNCNQKTYHLVTFRFCDTLLERLKEYYNHFHQNHLNNIKSVLATEEWKRLPLPRNYKQQSLLNLLAQFPNVQQKVRAIFRSSKSNVIESLSLDDIKKLNSPLTSFGNFASKQYLRVSQWKSIQVRE